MFEGFDTQRITVGDTTLSVRLGGAGDPLILLHGFPQTGVTWHKIAPALAQRHRVIIPDLPGYGDSDKPAPDPDHARYSKRRLAADMVGLADALGIARFALVGHDRGARVGYRLCLDHPHRVRRFVSIDVIPTLDVWEQMDADKAIDTFHWPFLAAPRPIPEDVIGADPRRFFGHLLDLWAGDPAALTGEARAAYLRQYDDPAAIAASCADYRAGATVDRAHDKADRDAGRKLACPVLVLWGNDYLGARSDMILGVWQRWADDVRDVNLACGHFIQEEAPQACLDAMLPFLSDGG